MPVVEYVPKAELTAANEQIEYWRDIVRKEVIDWYEQQLTAERAISDKLEKALKEIAAIEDLGIDDDPRNIAAHTLAEVETMRNSSE